MKNNPTPGAKIIELRALVMVSKSGEWRGTLLLPPSELDDESRIWAARFQVARDQVAAARTSPAA